jgi:hypothetical protein
VVVASVWCFTENAGVGWFIQTTHAAAADRTRYEYWIISNFKKGQNNQTKFIFEDSLLGWHSRKNTFILIKGVGMESHAFLILGIAAKFSVKSNLKAVLSGVIGCSIQGTVVAFLIMANLPLLIFLNLQTKKHPVKSRNTNKTV